MNYVFTFNEINYGRVEIEADSRPDDVDIVNSILEGRANYNNTDFVDIKLIEVNGEPHKDITKGGKVSKTAAWNGYLQYLRDWADSHEEPGACGTTPICFEEWCDNEYNEVTEDYDEELREFEVTITETLQKVVTVMASNQHEAEEIVQEEWSNQDHVLGSDNFFGVSFEPVPKKA